MDDVRNRYLRERVLTATPAQRVVMLYDRLALDLTRARTAVDRSTAGPYLAHAAQVVGELFTSLDRSAGGPAENLADLYSYLLRVLFDAQLGNADASLASVESIIGDLRAAWTAIADGTAGADAEPMLATGAWTA